MTKTAAAGAAALNDTIVAEYLEAFPEFFERYPALLQRLRLPDGRGSGTRLRRASPQSGVQSTGTPSAPHRAASVPISPTSTPLNDAAETRAIKEVFGPHAARPQPLDRPLGVVPLDHPLGDPFHDRRRIVVGPVQEQLELRFPALAESGIRGVI